MTSSNARSSRRGFLGRSLLCLSLASFLRDKAVADDEGLELIEAWIAKFNDLGKRLAAGALRQAEWQDGVAAMFADVSIPQLLKRIDFNRLGDQVKRECGESAPELFHHIAFDGTKLKPGPEPGRVLLNKLAYVRKGRAIPPHGHANMVSAFLNISGEFHIRLFDKLEDAGEKLIVRSAVDEIGGAGKWSSISDERNNVHWLEAKSEDCFLFTTKMIALEPKKPVHGRINIDIRRAKQLGDGLAEAPKITFSQAAELY